MTRIDANDGGGVFDKGAHSEYLSPMSRISIEVTPEQHHRLKAVAALHGQSVKDYILSQSIPGESDGQENPLHALESFLQKRINQVEAGELSQQSVSDIWTDVQRKQA
jgi:hypothetical protein